MSERTHEFLQLIDKQLKESGSPQKSSKRIAESSKVKSEFHETTSEISRGIHRVTSNLTKLTKLVKRQGLFDDPTSEINSLVVRIKQDLDGLNSKCDTAQQFVDTRRRQLGDKNQSISHSSKVVSQLKIELMTATKDFKSVLEARSLKMKDQQQKKVQLTGVGTLSPLRQFAASAAQAQTQGAQSKQPCPSQGMAPEKTGNRTNSGGFPKSPYSQLPSEEPTNNQSASLSSLPVQPQYSQQLLLAPPATQQYFEQREQAVTDIEKTIGELGTLFKRLATMITEQQELVERIDEDVESAISNADKAHTALLKTYEKVSSNKGLYMKLSAIIALFLIFFVLFML
mmetsp:Transcript_5291/g.5435  ORF Transcript_5291/g.5435 Transcript_5291/m.5435 type:complete len:342 (+) Transcript_5291:187-1212(+)